MSLSVTNAIGGGSIGAVENLLVPTLGTTTDKGVTCTNNGDGTYTVNGTATGGVAGFLLFKEINGSWKGKTLKIVGCPHGGDADNGYYLQLSDVTTSACNDVGNGATYTLNGSGCQVIIKVREGTVCNNLVFKPMLTTNLKATYKEFVKRVGGFNNLFVPTAPTQTVNGITFTNNGDGTYTLNGTTGSSSASLIVGNVSMEDGKQYKLTGCPEGGKIGGTSYYEIQYGQPVNGVDHGWGVICQGSSSADTRVWISVFPNTTANNLTFKPMLTESLLPEYVDFVKGVEGKKVAYGIYTPSSTSYTATINHALGVVPSKFMLFALGGAGAYNYQTVSFVISDIRTVASYVYSATTIASRLVGAVGSGSDYTYNIDENNITINITNSYWGRFVYYNSYMWVAIE